MFSIIYIKPFMYIINIMFKIYNELILQEKLDSFTGFTPENIVNLEEILNIERLKYESRIGNIRVRKDNEFYIQKIQQSTYTYSYNAYSFTLVDKLLIFTFDPSKEKWSIKNSGRH